MKESVQKFFILLLVVGGGMYVYSRWHNQTPELVGESEPTLLSSVEDSERTDTPASLVTAEVLKTTSSPPEVETKKVQAIAKGSHRPKDALYFRLEDGVAVVQGDVVVGALVDDDSTVESGFVKMPSLNLWRSPVIPIYISPNLSDPHRVLEALEMFSETVIQFVPFQDQEDVMVFEEGTGVCKSYVGRIGGKQPLWITPECRADDIAHEILHALGFVHEQNRVDRDQFIVLNAENIDEKYQENFFRLPPAFMTVSGLAPFDFDSLMIYPPTMFSKNGQPTMQSKVKDQTIRPSRVLSPRDVERVNRAYGNGL